MFHHQPRDLVYIAPELLPPCMVVFDAVCSWGSLKAFTADALSPVLLLRVWVFLVFLTVGFFLDFSVNAFFWSRVSCLFCYSFQCPGAWCGFYTMGFSPTVSTTSTTGWTGWKFVVAITFAVTCYFCTYSFGLRPQLEIKFKICLERKKKGIGVGFFT